MTNDEVNVDKGVSIILFIIMISVILGFGYLVYKADLKTEKERNIEIQQILNKSSEVENHRFYLKEMNTESFLNGKISGDFLLASGSIYGQIEQNKYINVVYYDNDTILDNITNLYRITKFDIETIEIETISKNNSAYFKYVESSYERCYFDEDCKYNKFKLGKPRLYLPEGWSILNLK